MQIKCWMTCYVAWMYHKECELWASVFQCKCTGVCTARIRIHICILCMYVQHVYVKVLLVRKCLDMCRYRNTYTIICMYILWYNIVSIRTIGMYGWLYPYHHYIQYIIYWRFTVYNRCDSRQNCRIKSEGDFSKLSMPQHAVHGTMYSILRRKQFHITLPFQFGSDVSHYTATISACA